MFSSKLKKSTRCSPLLISYFTAPPHTHSHTPCFCCLCVGYLFLSPLFLCASCHDFLCRWTTPGWPPHPPPPPLLLHFLVRPSSCSVSNFLIELIFLSDFLKCVFKTAALRNNVKSRIHLIPIYFLLLFLARPQSYPSSSSFSTSLLVCYVTSCPSPLHSPSSLCSFSLNLHPCLFSSSLKKQNQTLTKKKNSWSDDNIQNHHYNCVHFSFFTQVDSEAGSACEPSCLVLESDFLLSGELEFGDSEIMGLDRDGGMCTLICLSELVWHWECNKYTRKNSGKQNTQSTIGRVTGAFSLLV